MCRLGGYARLDYAGQSGQPLSDRYDPAGGTLISYRYTGYGQNYGKEMYREEERERTGGKAPTGAPTVYRGQKCCVDSRDCDEDGEGIKPLAFCSDRAKT